MSFKNWFRFVYVGVVWGSSFLWIKLGLEAFAPLTHTALRIFIALIALILFSLSLKPLQTLKQNWKSLAILGVLNVAIPFVLITYSQQSISSAMGSILNSTTPLFTMALAPLFVREERWTFVRVLGVLLGFAGVVVLVSGQLSGGGSAMLWGALMMLVAGLSYALAVIYARCKTHAVPVGVEVLGQNLTALLIIAPLALTFEGVPVLPAWADFPLAWASIFWMGIICIFIGTILFFALLKEVGPTRTSMTTYLYPLVGVLAGAVFLRESLDWRTFVGGGMILAGVVVANTNLQTLRKLRWWNKESMLVNKWK